MVFVGIDVAKNKHDCAILGDNGTCVLAAFSFNNDRNGFTALLDAVKQAAGGVFAGNVKAGLEATGHYGSNLAAFLRASGIEPVVFNPLQVKRYCQARSLRRTKTDKADAKRIAELLISDTSNPVAISYQMQELKSLTRSRFRLVKQCSKLKVSLSRLTDVLFPELTSIGLKLDQASVLTMLAVLPGAPAIAACRIDKLTNVLYSASKGRYGRQKAEAIKALAKESIAFGSEAASFELSQVIEHIQFAKKQLAALDKKIEATVAETKTPLTSIPCIGFRLAAVIISEIGDVKRFETPDQLLAFAGLDPSTYQSGSYQADKTPMVKHGSAYLRWGLMQAARLAATNCPLFRAFLQKKRAQGKHYFVALGHLSKKLVRVIFHMLNANEEFSLKAA